ncbi:uncharacterized protein LOC121409206 [Lytechinus variegatus]|uniref:uncharacterized protein LOC121409206 n=1 Tax=Lytechinus variegatus TaxID=7654 RepID=UPI001BB1E459|nr:uncharacterized protein LOC121409206 [Lytechinus variegatus]
MDEHTQLAMALSISLMDDKEQGSTAIEIPKPILKPKKRGRKKKKDEDLDEQTRVAMAISASLADETKQKNKDLGKNEERPGKKTKSRVRAKLKKGHQEFPVLLSRNNDERQKIWEERISALLEPSHSMDMISDHVFQPSTIKIKYLDPERRLLTETYPGNIKIKSGLQLWNATGADLSKNQTGKSPYYVEQLQPTIVPVTPKPYTSPISHSKKTPTKTPCKISPKATKPSNEMNVEESMSMTQSFGMTVQCLAELAEEGIQDSTSSDKCGFIPQDTVQRVDSPDDHLSNDQLTLLEELSSLVNSERMSDVMIQIDDGSKLHVHSFIIRLRCPALAEHLDQSPVRHSTNRPFIIVSDISYEAMENVLSYIYSATVNVTRDTAAETHKFAKRFKMTELALHCKPFLEDDTNTKATRKGSELDILDKDLNQLIDSLWEVEDDDDEKENARDAGRTSEDDDANETFNDDELKEIYEVSQRSRSKSFQDDDGDVVPLEDGFPLVSSPKDTSNDDGGTKDEDSAEEVLSEMMLTQGCRRSNTNSYCSHENISDGDDEDWSMVLDNEGGAVHSEENVQCLNLSSNRTTDKTEDELQENFVDSPKDIIGETPKGIYHSRRKGSDSSSKNERVDDEHHYRTFEDSFHAFLDHTLVDENDKSPISPATDIRKKRKASPEPSNVSGDKSNSEDIGERFRASHQFLLDDGTSRSDSPDDVVLLLPLDSGESENDKPDRIGDKNLQNMQARSQGENGKMIYTKVKGNTIGRRKVSSPRKKLLIQEYSPNSDSDNCLSPDRDVVEIHSNSTKETESKGLINESLHTSSLAHKKSSMKLDCNTHVHETDTRLKGFESQSSVEDQNGDDLKNRLESLDGSLSEDILSPSPPPSPKFCRASQLPRLEKIKDVRSPVSRNCQFRFGQSRTRYSKEKAVSLEEEDDTYQLSSSSSTSSINESMLSSSLKRNKKRKVKRDTMQSGSGDRLPSPSDDFSTDSTDTVKRWPNMVKDQDLPNRRSRDNINHEASPELPHNTSPPSQSRSHRISPSHSIERFHAAPGASPLPRASSTSPAGSFRQSPAYTDMQDICGEQDERFAFDMEEGCGFDDFSVDMDLPGDVDGNAGIINQENNALEDMEDWNRSHGSREGIVIGSHQRERLDQDKEIDLTFKEERLEDELMSDDLHQPPPALKDRITGVDTCNTLDESEQGGTPQANQTVQYGTELVNGQKKNRLPHSSQTTPSTSHTTAGTALKTPLRRIEEEYYPPAPITPMPDYGSMITPELKKELKRFGIKPLAKKKAKLLLTEIFSYLHQVMPEDESDEDTSSTAKVNQEPEPSKGRAKKGKATRKPATKKGQGQKKGKEESSSDDRATKKPKKPTKPRKRKTAEEILDETPTKRMKKESPVKERILDTGRSGVGTEDSTGVDELVSSQGSRSSSIDSDKNDFGESMYHEDEEEDDVVMATQQVQDMPTELKKYIMRNKELHQRILQYEVLNLEEFYKELKEAQVPCSKIKLIEFLDQQCITFRHKEGSRQRKPKKTKR